MLNFQNKTLLFVLLRLAITLGQETCKEAAFLKGSYCHNIESWEEFIHWVDESVPGDELYLCPFDIDKGDEPPLTIQWGLSIICVQSDESGSCILRGSGIIIDVVTSGDILLQSLSFEGGDDHAVHISSVLGGSGEVIRTLCYCSFTGYVNCGLI